MLVVKVYKENKPKTIAFKPEELIENSILEIIKNKTGQDVKADNIKVVGNKAIIKQPSEPTIVEIDEKDLLKQTVEGIIKKQLSLKTLKNIKVEVIGCKGK
jgi:hypothetical protein